VDCNGLTKNQVNGKGLSPAIPKMTNEQLFLIVVAVIVAIAIIVVALIHVSKNRHRIMRVILDRLNARPWQRKPHQPEQPFTKSKHEVLTAEQSKAELERLHKLIEDRKQIARDTDISHHVWGLYKSLLRYTSPQSLDRYIQDGEWYDVKILRINTQNDLNQFEFELKGARYKFVDDEEKQGWRVNTKLFSLFLYDDSDRCLLEIPMKMHVDSSGRQYSISSDGPKAFLPGGWTNDFINVKLKHQRIRNQEIRAQKHQERLCEIEDLRDRFGIWD
jgi:hypothetical protein